MKNKKTILIVSLVAVVAILALVFFSSSNGENNEKPNDNQNETNSVLDNTNKDNNSNNLNSDNSDASDLNSGIDLSDAEASDVEVFAEKNELEVIKAVELSEELIASTGEAGVKTVNVTVSDKGFSPSTIKAQPRQIVTINLGVVDDNEHAFKFVEEGIMSSSVIVTSGYSLGFSFAAPIEAGELNFFDERFPENKGKIIIE